MQPSGKAWSINSVTRDLASFYISHLFQLGVLQTGCPGGCKMATSSNQCSLTRAMEDAVFISGAPVEDGRCSFSRSLQQTSFHISSAGSGSHAHPLKDGCSQKGWGRLAVHTSWCPLPGLMGLAPPRSSVWLGTSGPCLGKGKGRG